VGSLEWGISNPWEVGVVEPTQNGVGFWGPPEWVGGGEAGC
jgi:hypothetical protein